MLYCTVKSKAQQNWLRKICCIRRLLSIQNASCTDGCLYNILVQNVGTYTSSLTPDADRAR